MTPKIAVVGAGVYGTTSAIRLAERGYRPTVFDPLGILRAASAINQYRIHAGYHYPRSPETIHEVLSARKEFMTVFAPAIVANCQNYYAIPREGSLTPPDRFEEIMEQHGLPLIRCRPNWINSDFIHSTYRVDENIYDEGTLRNLLTNRMSELKVHFVERKFDEQEAEEYDYVIWATYGIHSGYRLFKQAKYQVAEKVLIRLPQPIRHVAIVVIDGPFTAFDPYGNSDNSLFGSAVYTNHWSSFDPNEPIPEIYAGVLNRAKFERFSMSRFEVMRSTCALSVPLAHEADYIGSRFTMRVVEHDPSSDRRILYVAHPTKRDIYIFSGKVVSAVTAARSVCNIIDGA